MSITQFHENSFQTKLEHSIQSLKVKDLNDYWLNKDGSFTPKTHWFGRVVRWFLNLCYDKTINDIWSVFQRAMIQFEASRENCADLYCDNALNLVEANGFVAERRERLRFAVKFLMSRKNKFDKWVKKNPKNLNVLKHYIDKYNTHLAKHPVISHVQDKGGQAEKLVSSQTSQKISSEYFIDSELVKIKGKINQANVTGIKKLVSSLENVYLPSINKKLLSKRPPPLKLAVTPEHDPIVYSSTDIAGLMCHYDEIPLNKENKGGIKKFIEVIKTPEFYNSLSKLLKKQKFQHSKTSIEDAVASTKTMEELKLQLQHITAAPEGSDNHEYHSTGKLIQLFGIILNVIVKQIPKPEPEDNKNSHIEHPKEVADEIFKNFLIELSGISIDKVDFLSLKKVYDNRKNLENLIEKVKVRDANVFGVNSAIHDKYYDQIELFLKNILYVIDNDKKLTKTKKKSVLNELSIAAGECGARWIEETKKQYRALTLLNASELEVKVLEHVQAFKEDLFLELFQNLTDQVEYHILDSFRIEYGKELGLDDSTVDLDVFTYKIDKKGLRLLKRIFLLEYNAPRVMKGITERINLQLESEFESSYFTYLAECVEKRFPKISDPSEYVMNHFMGPDYKSINEDGTLLILQGMKILKR